MHKWIKFDLGDKREVRCIQTKGCGCFGWLESYRLSFSDGDADDDDRSAWTWLDRTFDGNIDNHSPKSNDLSPSIRARFIRLHPMTERGTGGWTLQVELFGPPEPDLKNAYSMLLDMQKDQDFTDCTLKCGDRTFPCHRIVLASASSVLRAALSGGFREASDATIVIDDAAPIAVEALLSLIYTSRLDDQHALSLLPLAHKYAIDHLTERCVHAIMTGCISADNVVEVVSLMSTYADHKAVSEAWKDLVEKVRQDAELAGLALRCVRRRLS